MCIDVHAHHVPASYMELLRAGGGPGFGAPHDEQTLRRMIAGQDELGIRTQVLSTGPNSPYLRDAGRAAAAARHINDVYRDIVERHAGRFAAFGSVPLPHGEAAAAEAVRCLDELGFAGIHVGCSALGHALDDPGFDALWTALDERAAVVYVHPGGILCGTEPGLAGMDDPAIAVTIGSAAELATAALKLVSVCRKRRRLRVIVGLLGGALPFLLQRVVWLSGRIAVPAPTDGGPPPGSLIDELRRFSYDTNLLPDPAVIPAALRAYGIGRLLFGSDAPALSPSDTARLLREGGIDDDDFMKILRDNPAALFGTSLGRPRPHASRTERQA